MKRKVAKVGRLRLSPNEEAQLVKEELERRRKLRLQQVREQERYIALQIRKEVQHRRDCELQNLAEVLQEEWQRQQRDKLQTLEKLYQDSLKAVGEGHRSAKENEVDLEAMAQKAEAQHERAAERHREALRELKSQKRRLQEEQSRLIQARRIAMLKEKERAAKVASLPPHPPKPFEKMEAKTPHPVKISDVDNFSVTHFHMPETAVHREGDTDQPDARRAAEQEVRRLEELEKEEDRERREQLAKARLRGVHALRKEHLYQDKERLLQELAHMQQADLLRRRKAVAQMPPQTFQPHYSRQEMTEDRQRDLEFAFEDMYSGERRMKGDLVLQLVPEPLPALSSDAHDDDLDVTLEPEVPPAAERHAAGHQSPLPPTQTEAEPIEGAPAHVLSKLLNKIRTQRSHWCSRADGEMATDSMTIESGSLPREDRVQCVPPISPHPDHLQPSQGHETTEDSVIAGALLPHKEQAIKVRLVEAERRKQEKELQEQIELLQQLEEQRSSLELHLQQAQLERERPQATVHDNPEELVQQEIPAHEQEAPSAPSVRLQMSLEPQCSAEEHSRKVHQYQQRVLAQSRQHKQCLEEARGRLLEYQHALKMRYPRAPMVALGPALHLVLPTGLPRGPCVPTAMPLPPFTATPSQGDPGATVTLPSGPSDMQTSDAGVLSPGLPSIPVQDSYHIPQTLPFSAPGTERLLQEHLTSLESEHGANPPRPTPNSPTQGSLPANPAPQALQVYRPAPAPTASCGQPDRAPPRPPAPEPAPAMGAQWRELQEAQQRLEEQRRAVRNQEGEQEEKLLLQQNQLRRQREILDAFLADAKPRPSGLEVSRAERLSLMSTLLRAIEESNNNLSPSQSTERLSHLSVTTNLNQVDSLSHASLSSDCRAQQCSLLSRAVTQPPDPKPPLARVRLGILELMEQHELSAIQEVETPVDASLATVGEESMEMSCTLEEPEQSESRPSSTSRGSGTECWTSSGPEASSGTGRYSRLSWRERLQQEFGSSAQPAQRSTPSLSNVTGPILPAHSFSQQPVTEAQVLEELISLDAARVWGSLHTSDMGLGARKGGRIHQCSEDRCSLPSEKTPVDPECLSSFTISTGSFSTTEPDFSSTGFNVSLSDEAAGGGRPLSARHRNSDSSSPASASLLDNSDVQRIIDKYTKELDISMAAAGNLAVVPSPTAKKVVLDPGESSSSISLPWSRALLTVENRFPASGPNFSSVPSGLGTSAQKVCGNSTGSYLQGTLGSRGAMEALEGVSKDRFEGAHNSFCHFVSLEPRLDSSSSSRHSERPIRAEEWDSASLVTGHLSDHSSAPYQAEGRDSTLIRSISHLSAQPTWRSEVLDFTMAQSVSPLLDEGRLLTSEWEELSAGPQSESFGGAAVVFQSGRERGVPPQMGQSPEPAALPGAPLLSPRFSDPKPNTQEATPLLVQASQSSVQDVFVEPQDTVISTGDNQDWEHTADDHRTLVDPTSDFFHPLLAEVTQNDSSTFHLFEPDLPFPGGNDHILNAEVSSAGVLGEGTEQLSSPELPRALAQDPSLCSSPSPMNSLCLLRESPGATQNSLLTEFLSTKVVSRLPVSNVPSLALFPEGECSDSACQDVLTLKELAPGNLATRPADGERSFGSTPSLLAWEKILETGSERGILEEPELTLMNLTESTALELSNAEEEEEKEVEIRDESNEPLSESCKFDSFVDDCRTSKHDSLPSHAVMLPEFQQPPGDLQQAFLQKRQHFIQRSAQRLADLRARKEVMRDLPHANRPEVSVQSQCSHNSQPPLLAGVGELKKVGEVRVFAPEHRKVEAAQMHQRTERLYNQLEEVRQRKEMRLRQESYAKNREKAKAFQRKTLQKLRARQAHCSN